MRKYIKMSPYGVAASGIIAFAVLFRLAMSAVYLPTTNTDEGTMGIEAMHIAFRGEWPIYFYSQNYMGVIEAYIAAVFFHLFGVSVFSLRLGMILLFALFLVALYLLTSLLYTKKLALFTLAVLSLGALDVLIQQLRAVGGAVETLLFGTVILLLATWLALTVSRNALPGEKRKRLVAYGFWGFTVGIGLWTHLLVLPFVLAGGLILLVFCRREWLSLAPLLILVGFVIGAFPMIYFYVTHPSENSLTAALYLHDSTTLAQEYSTHILRKEFIGTFLWSLPQATGLNPVCALTDLPYYGPATSQTVPCIIAHGSWSAGYMALLSIALVMAALGVWKALQARRFQGKTWSEEERRSAVIQFVRLMILLSAALTIALYLSSPLSGLKPWSTRYLVGIWIAIPSVLWPLWRLSGIEKLQLPSIKHIRLLEGFNRIALLAIFASILGTTAVTVSMIPATQAQDRQQEALIQDLLRVGATHIYTEYWTCDRLNFQSQERVICIVLDAGTFDRYPAYRPIVKNDPRAAYVYPAGMVFIAQAQKNLERAGIPYREFTFDGYVVIQPVIGTTS